MAMETLRVRMEPSRSSSRPPSQAPIIAEPEVQRPRMSMVVVSQPKMPDAYTPLKTRTPAMPSLKNMRATRYTAMLA